MIKLYQKMGKLPKYTVFSMIATALDFSIAWVFTMVIQGNIVFANTVGSLCGFFLHYTMASKTVFRTDYGAIGFVIYLSTFLFGMILSNIIIYYSYHWLLAFTSDHVAFLIGKLIAVTIPFFIVYYLRDLIFKRLNS